MQTARETLSIGESVPVKMALVAVFYGIYMTFVLTTHPESHPVTLFGISVLGAVLSVNLFEEVFEGDLTVAPDKGKLFLYLPYLAILCLLLLGVSLLFSAFASNAGGFRIVGGVVFCVAYLFKVIDRRWEWSGNGWWLFINFCCLVVSAIIALFGAGELVLQFIVKFMIS